jgi:dTDP-4-amino-4,6-dideoxygalactose transaminase
MYGVEQREFESDRDAPTSRLSATVELSRPLLGAEEEAAVLAVLRSGRLTQGPEVEAFEAEFSAATGGRHAVAVSSGTAALHLLLLAHGVGPGDEVILPSFTFAASANAVRLSGAEAVFVDIEPESFCVDPGAVRAAVTARTAAILAVHLYGHPSDMGALAELARSSGILLLEDAAQAHAATVDGVPVGALGDGGAFSFYPSKNMTTGEGGMVTSRDAAAAERVRVLRNQGMAAQYEHRMVGFNLRLTDIQAAIGRVQLAALATRTEKRRRHAAAYDAGVRGVVTPTVRPGVCHAYHQYTVRSRDRDTLQAHLRVAGVESRPYYPIPVHRLDPYSSSVELPETDRAAGEVLSIPVGPHLSDADVAHVIEALSAWEGG